MAQDIQEWLGKLGLERYAATLRENDVDLRALALLTDEDLKELGVSLGHRRIILAARDEPSSTRTERAPQEVPPGEQDAAAGSALAERRILTVLFSDLVSSTQMANKLDPEEMREILRQYQDRVAGAVTRFGGYVSKFLGDGLLVYFGWPLAFEDHADRAVRAGLDVLRVVKEIRLPDGTPLQVRVGIDTGGVVVGDLVGDNTRENDAVTGQTPNMAARLLAEADPDTLVISQSTHDMLGAAFKTAALGARKLKGFDHAVPIHRVTGERVTESRFAAARGDVVGRLVGRVHESGLLRQSWQRACAGHGEAILIGGEGGIGKSRLLEAFINEVDDASVTIIRLQCSPYFTSSAFHPFAEVLARRVGIAPEDDDAERVAKIRAFHEKTEKPSGDLNVWATLVAPASDVAKAIRSMPPQEQKEATQRLMTRDVLDECQKGPVLFVVEDAHWIDPSTLETIERIIGRSTDLPLMTMVTHRPEWRSTWVDDHPNIKSLRLERLDAAEVIDVLTDILGRAPEDDFARTIIERSEGVPLFVEELARAALDTASTGQAEIPPTLQATFIARLDRVPALARRVALVASVMGREFDADVVARASALGPDEFAGALAALRRAGVVFESGLSEGVFAFRHALLQDAAYQSMVSSTRREYHTSLAQALLDLRAGEADREPEIVARHLTEAEEHERAYPYWRSAAERALARSASLEAMAHAQAALAAATATTSPSEAAVIEAEILVGRAQENIGNLLEAVRRLYATANRAEAAGKMKLFADAAYHFTDAALSRGDHADTATELCRKALDDTSFDDQPMRCRLLSQLARTSTLIGDFAASAEYAREASALAEKLGDRREQFSLLMTRFTAPAVARGQAVMSDWRRLLDRMLELADGLSDIDRGRERAIDIYISAEMGDRDRMENSLRRLAEVGEIRKHMHMQWVETHGRAMQAILDGDWSTAETFAKKGLKIGRETHGEHVEGVYGVQMFTIRREQARLHEVAPVIKRQMDDDPENIQWKPGFALIAAELGYTEAANRMLDEIAAEGFQLKPDAMYSTTLGYLAQIAVAVGAEEHGERIYQLLLPYQEMTITAGVTTVCAGAAARFLGALASKFGDWDTAEAHFERALDINETMRASPWIAHTQADFALALLARGRTADQPRVDDLLKQALQKSQELEMKSLQVKLRQVSH